MIEYFLQSRIVSGPDKQPHKYLKILLLSSVSDVVFQYDLKDLWVRLYVPTHAAGLRTYRVNTEQIIALTY